jgi:hypothetical protein
MDWATVVVTDGRVLTKRMQRQFLLHKRQLVRDGFGFNMPLDRREFFVRLLPARTGHPTSATHSPEADIKYSNGPFVSRRNPRLRTLT